MKKIYLFIYIYIYICIYITQNKTVNANIVLLTPMCKNAKGNRMNNSHAISILNCAFYSPCFFT